MITTAFQGNKGAAARFLKAVTRGFVPGGSEGARIEQALRLHPHDPGAFVRTLFGIYQQKTGASGSGLQSGAARPVGGDSAFAG